MQGPGAADKVRVFCLSQPSATCSTYVHAKTWIFDDKFATIGSANCNRRGMTYDSEVSAGIFDASSDDQLTYCFAHWLRIRLWAHNLGLDGWEGYPELADGVGSGDNWLAATRPPNARVEEYDARVLVEGNDVTWDTMFDPDGSGAAAAAVPFPSP